MVDKCIFPQLFLRIIVREVDSISFMRNLYFFPQQLIKIIFICFLLGLLCTNTNGMQLQRLRKQ